ncbi:MAG: sulfatase-like hydrolase/transferase [Actinomycetota bacterium]|nr:sulfatase-like hydrolase/transferase [Actinomycetota bacterium]
MIRRSPWWARALAALIALGAAAIVLVALTDGDRVRGNGHDRPPADAPNAPNIDPDATGRARGPLAEAPNIVFVLTDDQSLDSFTPRSMPETFAKIVRPGTRFGDAVAAPPLCCPYRAGFLTGQYPHNNGVLSNKPGYTDLSAPGHTFGNWLRGRGYETALIGKYLNGIEDLPGAVVAPGWDEWLSAWFGSGMLNPRLNDDGSFVRRRGYLTNILTNRALEFIDASAPRGRPFFLWLTQLSPHSIPRGRLPTDSCEAGMPQPTKADFEGFAGPRFSVIGSKPSFNERDISDKPRDLPRIDGETRQRLRRYWRCEVSSLAAVDRGVGRIVDRLEALGELDNTILVFSSDNGFLHGEHRDVKGKGDIFREQMEVPLAVRVPASLLGSPPAPAVGRTVTQLDLTATLLDLAGADPCLAGRGCRRMDGRSLIKLLRGEDPRWARDRKILFELDNRCTQIGVRTKRHTYSQIEPACGGGDVQLYDRTRDPYELRNVARRKPQLVEDLRRTTLRLVRCSGASGRDEKQAGAPFCR